MNYLCDDTTKGPDIDTLVVVGFLQNQLRGAVRAVSDVQRHVARLALCGAELDGLDAARLTKLGSCQLVDLVVEGSAHALRFLMLIQTMLEV